MTADGTLRLNAGGYGYGLGIRQTCDYRTVVSHTGGLPGFGSEMRWLVDEGVATTCVGRFVGVEYLATVEARVLAEIGRFH